MFVQGCFIAVLFNSFEFHFNLVNYICDQIYIYYICFSIPFYFLFVCLVFECEEHHESVTLTPTQSPSNSLGQTYAEYIEVSFKIQARISWWLHLFNAV